MIDPVIAARPGPSHGRWLPLHARPWALFVAGVCVGPAVLAQEAGAARSTTLVPSLSISETYTDNALLRDDDKRGDLVTQLTAGLSLGHRSARLTGSLDYSVSGSAHARETKANEVTQGLRAQLRGELVSNWLYIDSSASISQQTISAFGLQTTDTAFDSSNRTEVRSLNLSPYLLRPLGTWGQIEARLQHGRQSAASTTLGDSTSNTGSLVVSSQGAPRLGWSVSAVRQRVDYESGRQSTTDALSVGTSYRVGADLRLNGSIGRDKSDIVSVADTHSTTWALGVQWLPSERTQFVLQREQRYFGDGHRLVYTQRLSRASWSLSSSRDVSTGATSFVPTSTSTMFALLFASLAAEQPDPLQRAILVLQRLAALGISPNAEVTFGFLNSQVTLVSRQDASFAWQGVRTSFSAAAYRSDSRRLDEGAQAIDPLGGATRVRQHGYSLTLGHKLTPVTGISLTLSDQRTADAGTTRGNDLRSLLLNWTTQLGREGRLSLGARRVEFDSLTNPYTENAVFATYGVRF